MKKAERPPHSPSRRAATVLGAIATSAGLLLISFPHGWAFRPAAWFALVPWLLLIRSSPPLRAFLYSWAVGAVFFLPGISWLRFVTIPGWLMLSFYLSLYFAAFGLLYRLAREWGLIASPFTWVALEFARARLLTGFPWFSLGYSQATVLPLIQVADFGSVYAVSFLIVFVNLVLVEASLCVASRSPCQFRRAAVAVGAAVLLVAAASAYGVWRLRTLAPERGPRIAAVQGNIPQNLKLAPGTAADVFLKYRRLTDQITPGSVDMILWPETMLLLPLNRSEHARIVLADIARSKRAHLLIGSPAVVQNPSGEEQHHNSAYLISQTGEILRRYDKLHLVPFGEYTPVRRHLPFLARLVPYEKDYSPGRAPVVFRLGRFYFTVLICYEDTIPHLVRAVAPPHPGFLINLTNDGWFRNSPELEQHLEISTFRAIETRMGLARAANTGVSAVISPTGRIEKIITDKSGKFREVKGILTSPVAPGGHPQTPYMRLGDLFAFSCVGISPLLFFLALLRKRRRG